MKVVLQGRRKRRGRVLFSSPRISGDPLSLGGGGLKGSVTVDPPTAEMAERAGGEWKRARRKKAASARSDADRAILSRKHPFSGRQQPEERKGEIERIGLRGGGDGCAVAGESSEACGAGVTRRRRRGGKEEEAVGRGRSRIGSRRMKLEIGNGSDVQQRS